MDDCVVLSAGSGMIAAKESNLKASSPLLNFLTNTKYFQEQRILFLNPLSENSEVTLKRAMEFIHRGEISLEGCSPQQLSALAQELKISELQKMLEEYPVPGPSLPKPIPVPAFTPSIFPMSFPLNPLLYGQLPPLNWLQMVEQLKLFVPPINEQRVETVCKRKRAEMKKAHSVEEESYENMGDVIIPSTENEGWCRNKKYIEKTENGFMCTVCKKVYGRYNSVSYHVTIYHRNPPIKCDTPGCQFTTREARYIHFHKFYRHSIPLPHSIDQGTRRCPHCRHVSKSPAMLEKHIRRHQENSDIKEETITDSGVDLHIHAQERSRTDSQSTVESTEMEIDDDPKPRAFTLCNEIRVETKASGCGATRRGATSNAHFQSDADANALRKCVRPRIFIRNVV